MGPLKLELEESLETEIVYCYCCEDFTEHEIYQGDDNNIFYQCDCGCLLDDSVDEIIEKEK